MSSEFISVGEKLNSSNRSVAEAFDSRDESAVRQMISAQINAGAEWLDINAAAVCRGNAEKEAELLRWTVSLVPDDIGIMLDSASVDILASAHEICDGHRVILNSVTPARGMDRIPEYAASHGYGIVLLPLTGAKLPKSSDEALATVKECVDIMRGAGVSDGDIYADILITPAASVSPDGIHGLTVALSTLQAIKGELPDIKTIAGISNASFGLPARGLINSALLTAAVIGGLDAAIYDVLSTDTQNALAAALAVGGRDEYCLDYVARMKK